MPLYIIWQNRLLHRYCSNFELVHSAGPENGRISDNLFSNKSCKFYPNMCIAIVACYTALFTDRSSKGRTSCVVCNPPKRNQWLLAQPILFCQLFAQQSRKYLVSTKNLSQTKDLCENWLFWLFIHQDRNECCHLWLPTAKWQWPVDSGNRQTCHILSCPG